MNSITVTGKLIADPSSRQAGQHNVAQFSVGEYVGKNQDGSYKPAPVWNCEVWGDRGGRILEHARKGTQITLVGRVKREKYQTKEGEQRDVLKLDVTDFDIQREGPAAGMPKAAQQAMPPFDADAPAEAEGELPF